MDPEILKVVIGAATVFLGLGIMFGVMRSKGRRRLERLGPAFELGTSRTEGFLANRVGGIYRGYSCSLLIQHPSQYDRGGATLRVAASSPHTWSAEVPKPGARLMVKVGLFKDLDIGDRFLDERLRFSAEDEASLTALFGTEVVRAAMHRLVGSENFESIQTRDDRVEVKWSPRVAALDEDPEVFRNRLELVTDLVSACSYPPRLDP
jgi:hypothetical protein